MKTPHRLCPVAMYVSRCFAACRQASGHTIQQVAEQVPCAQQVLQQFEQGEGGLDVLLILRLEKILRLDYAGYKPPVSYFGFLGFTADVQPMLLETKKVTRRARKSFRHPHAKRRIEHALLKLRFAPLRGLAENMLY